MKAIKTAFLRSNTKDILDQVAGGETFIIARPANQNAVLLSEEAYNEMLEAAALIGEPRIAQRAQERVLQADSAQAEWLEQEEALRAVEREEPGPISEE